ncbi:MAG: ABC transporter substrate-binding protein [Nitratireductor sp.]
MLFRLVIVFIASFLIANSANARCAHFNKVSLRAALPKYAILQPVINAMRECGNLDVKLIEDLSNIGVVQGGSTQKPENILGVSTSNFDSLVKRNALKPLNDLIKRFGSNLNERQFQRVDGKIVAIALAANTQNLLIHRDLFRRENLSAPKTYVDLIEAAKKLLPLKAIKKPLSMSLKDGWNVANHFVNLHLANGGKLIDENQQPFINTSQGVYSLNLLKELVAFVPEDFSTIGPQAVLQNLIRGEVGMAILWGSNLSAIDNETISRVSGRMDISPVPTLQWGTVPASTLWWDGIGISISSTDEEAEAAFKVIMEGIDDEMVKANKNVAVWLMDSYKPGRLAKGIFDAVERKIPNYPATQASELLHAFLGQQIPLFLKGEKSAKEALSEVESLFVKAASERGLIK